MSTRTDRRNIIFVIELILKLVSLASITGIIISFSFMLNSWSTTGALFAVNTHVIIFVSCLIWTISINIYKYLINR